MDVDTAVRTALGADRLRLEAVRREPVAYDAFLAGRTIARVAGTARLDGDVVAWSFIEKRTEGPPVASTYLHDNAVREVAAYRSGILEHLAPGVGAPRLLGAENGEDGGLTLWLEDLRPSAANLASREAVVLAARHLGRLSGRWLGNVPDEPWLFGGWIERHSQPEAREDGAAVVEAARGDTRIQARLHGRLDEAARLIAAQDEYAAVLRRLPRTLCHHDAVAANVFRRETDAEPETILIDWESVGPGPIGADLASLLFASPRRGDFPARLLRDLVSDALAAYAGGIAEMGASVEPDELRLGLHASISLRWALVRDVIRILGSGGSALRGSALGESADQALGELLALVPVLLDSAAEARRVMTAR